MEIGQCDNLLLTSFELAPKSRLVSSPLICQRGKAATKPRPQTERFWDRKMFQKRDKWTRSGTASTCLAHGQLAQAPIGANADPSGCEMWRPAPTELFAGMLLGAYRECENRMGRRQNISKCNITD